MKGDPLSPRCNIKEMFRYTACAKRVFMYTHKLEVRAATAVNETEQAESGGHADKPWMPGAPRTSLSGLHCTLGQITALSGRLLRSLSCLLRHIKGQRVSWPVMLVIDKLSRDSSGQGAPPLPSSALFWSRYAARPVLLLCPEVFYTVITPG